MAMAHSTPPPVTTYDPFSALPPDHLTVSFSNVVRLTRAAEHVYTQLKTNSDEGNQYIVVLGLSNYAIQRLKDEPHILGVSCRLEFDGSTAIIKVKPGDNHEGPVNLLISYMVVKFAMMGILPGQCRFRGAARRAGTVTTKAKEPDQSFYPPSRIGVPGQARPWPTVVIDVGNSDSLPKMRMDALWWFNNSQGDVRIAIVMKVEARSRSILIEKWQLAPPNTPLLTQAILDGFRQSNPPALPPLVRQPAATQQAYSIQEITVTPTSATAQLVLPFHAMYDRPPVPPEADIVFTVQELIELTGDVWV
ncbi:hypothetical protein DTO212C5_2189 [Paecilomyces variotii]|nr:hypothetical protein DTO212C5_2189 [Paecilomyces variotii]